jgi:hypothetical protein
MGPGTLVVVQCHNPPEKLWGKLLRLNALGVVLRGLNLNSIEDWLAQEKTGEEGFIEPSTVYIPVHRIERIYVDESTRVAPAFGERFEAACGVDVRDALGGDDER